MRDSETHTCINAANKEIPTLDAFIISSFRRIVILVRYDPSIFAYKQQSTILSILKSNAGVAQTY